MCFYEHTALSNMKKKIEEKKQISNIKDDLDLVPFIIVSDLSSVYLQWKSAGQNPTSLSEGSG